MDRYTYKGPVLRYGKIISSYIVMSTSALTEAKALSNISFQVKKLLGFEPTVNISLPGQLTKTIKEEENDYGHE